ncbi:hypothetical protein AX17_005524 [Amanita inopinata Kibby_2008]|nr:hypothetical protein AX17_005524 [Amanita inopinata Kibby_2008]
MDYFGAAWKGIVDMFAKAYRKLSACLSVVFTRRRRQAPATDVEKGEGRATNGGRQHNCATLVTNEDDSFRTVDLSKDEESLSPSFSSILDQMPIAITTPEERALAASILAARNAVTAPSATPTLMSPTSDCTSPPTTPFSTISTPSTVVSTPTMLVDSATFPLRYVSSPVLGDRGRCMRAGVGGMTVSLSMASPFPSKVVDLSDALQHHEKRNKFASDASSRPNPPFIQTAPFGSGLAIIPDILPPNGRDFTRFLRVNQERDVESRMNRNGQDDGRAGKYASIKSSRMRRLVEPVVFQPSEVDEYANLKLSGLSPFWGMEVSRVLFGSQWDDREVLESDGVVEGEDSRYEVESMNRLDPTYAWPFINRGSVSQPVMSTAQD